MNTKQQQPFRVGLKLVSDEACVSLATASLVLRGKDKSSEATRQRVLSVAKRLRYRPNLLVHGLQRGRTATVGVVVPLVGFFSNIAHGLYEALAEDGYLPIFHYQTDMYAPDVTEKELAIIHRLIDQRVDGIILFPADESVGDLYFHEVWQRGIPLVTIDRQLGMTHADFVGTDDFAGGRLAAEHLLALGHRYVAQVSGPLNVGTYASRRKSFSNTIVAAGGTCQIVELDEPQYAEAARGLLALNPLPTAVFLETDNAAPALYRSAQAQGLRIPRDLSVVGFADVDWAEFLDPGLTTLHQTPAMVGRRAAKILLDRINGKLTSKKPLQERLMPKLVVRNSTAPPRQS